VVIDNAAQTRLTATIAVLSGEVLAAFSNAHRTQHHVCHEAEVWAQVAKTGHGLGVTSTSYKLGYTDGMDDLADMDAIRQAATQQAVRQAKAPHKKKRAATEILNIKYRCQSYKAGLFKQQWANTSHFRGVGFAHPCGIPHQSIPYCYWIFRKTWGWVWGWVWAHLRLAKCGASQPPAPGLPKSSATSTN
jgi:hypothetical protein